MDGRARTVRARASNAPRDAPTRAGKFSFGSLRRRKLWTLFTRMSRVDLQDIVPFIYSTRKMLTLAQPSINRPILWISCEFHVASSGLAGAGIGLWGALETGGWELETGN